MISKRVAGLMVHLMLLGICQADSPNVIVIMADDIGAEGLGCYGSTIYTTPHLDRMASEGARFENAYATPLCTPTRVMLMSGLYPNRTGFRALISKQPGVRLPTEIRTFGNDFQDAGYHTAIAGKWQLGKFDEHPGQPTEHGFDEYCLWSWFYGGKKSSRYYKPQFYQNGTIIDGAEKDFGPDTFRDFVLNFIDRHHEEPFFVYYPMALVHSPFVHPPQLETLARSQYPGDLDKSTQAFGHMITYMDDVVGQILARLRQHGIADNTLVLFTGDNGTGRPITSRLPGLQIKGGKGTMTEAGSRVPFLAWWPGTISPGVRDEFLCLVDVLPTIAAIADIPLKRDVDGMNLAHNLLGTTGNNRPHVLINYKQGFFVRDRMLRLNEDGRLYHIPVSSDAARYAERETSAAEFAAHRQRLQQVLDDFMAIPQQYDHRTDSPPASKKKRKKGQTDKKAAKEKRPSGDKDKSSSDDN
ncbi:MAG: sulfatase-like hydrolase/transferase [Planctomycetaceae bacterium]|nr:sulfatase-like hydrolase/transferase [Planctomycetaceae bacterium]